MSVWKSGADIPGAFPPFFFFGLNISLTFLINCCTLGVRRELINVSGVMRAGRQMDGDGGVDPRAQVVLCQERNAISDRWSTERWN